jgi:EpsI family protein
VLLSLGLLAATFLFLQVRSTGEAVPVVRPLAGFPDRIGAWQGREATVLDGGTLAVLRPSDYLVRRYVDASGRSLWLYVGYWDTQRRGAQPHSPKNCLPGGGWEPLDASRIEVPLAAGGAVPVNRFVLQKEREQQVVLYWYQAQGRAVAGEVEARVQMVRSAILRNRTDGAIVRVSSPVHGTVGDTVAWLTAYVQALYPQLGRYLPG